MRLVVAAITPAVKAIVRVGAIAGTPRSSGLARVHRRSAFTAVKVDPDVSSTLVLSQGSATTPAAICVQCEMSSNQCEYCPINETFHQLPSQKRGESPSDHTFAYLGEQTKHMIRQAMFGQIGMIATSLTRNGEALA